MRQEVVWVLMAAFCTDLPFAYENNEMMDNKKFHIQDQKPSKNEKGPMDTNGNTMVLLRHKRSASNDSISEVSSSKSAIEEFYSDPSNRAMYLVLPIIILIYGGCSSLYCINKCRLYLIRRRIRAERRKRRRERERMNNDEFRWDDEPPNCSSSPNTIKRSKSMVDMPTEKQNQPVVRPFSSIPVFSQEKNNREFENNENKVNNDSEANLTLDDIENNQDENIPFEASDFDTRPKTKTPEKQTVEDLTESLHGIEEPDVKDKETSFIENEKKPSVEIANETILTTKENIDPSSKVLKPSKQLANLSFEEVAEILSYYGEKKHMPDVIPEEEENVVPLKKKVKKWKYKVFNS